MSVLGSYGVAESARHPGRKLAHPHEQHQLRGLDLLLAGARLTSAESHKGSRTYGSRRRFVVPHCATAGRPAVMVPPLKGGTPLPIYSYDCAPRRKVMNMRPVVRVVATVAVVGGSLVTFGGRTFAATAVADLAASATVVNNCSITTAALAFGPYDPVVANVSTNLDGTGRVSIACTKGSTATVALGSGSNASGSTRRLSDGSSNYLSYELYQDSGRSTVWNGGSGTLTPAPAPSKVARDFTVYGRIVGNQDVPAGSYSDTVVATVNF